MNEITMKFLRNKLMITTFLAINNRKNNCIGIKIAKDLHLGCNNVYEAIDDLCLLGLVKKSYKVGREKKILLTTKGLELVKYLNMINNLLNK